MATDAAQPSSYIGGATPAAPISAASCWSLGMWYRTARSVWTGKCKARSSVPY